MERYSSHEDVDQFQEISFVNTLRTQRAFQKTQRFLQIACINDIPNNAYFNLIGQERDVWNGRFKSLKSWIYSQKSIKDIAFEEGIILKDGRETRWFVGELKWTLGIVWDSTPAGLRNGFKSFNELSLVREESPDGSEGFEKLRDMYIYASTTGILQKMIREVHPDSRENLILNIKMLFEFLSSDINLVDLGKKYGFTREDPKRITSLINRRLTRTVKRIYEIIPHEDRLKLASFSELSFKKSKSRKTRERLSLSKGRPLEEIAKLINRGDSEKDIALELDIPVDKVWDKVYKARKKGLVKPSRKFERKKLLQRLEHIPDSPLERLRILRNEVTSRFATIHGKYFITGDELWAFLGWGGVSSSKLDEKIKFLCDLGIPVVKKPNLKDGSKNRVIAFRYEIERNPVVFKLILDSGKTKYGLAAAG